MKQRSVEKAFEMAVEAYGELGVDVEKALDALSDVSISLHCWQGDDVGGFENTDASLGGGLAVTGNHPGKARNIEELQADLRRVYALLPGHHRLNLHAVYGDFGDKKVDRDAIEPAHYQAWVDFAKAEKLGLDFNATCFSHPMADSGFTLSSPDPTVRDFWIEHVRRCRSVGAYFGKELGTPAVHNLWIPDGAKDETPNRYRYRRMLVESLEEIYCDRFDGAHLLDSVESKLFGIGSESFVVGSYDFYLSWALAHKTLLCLDMGHFHPTESVADKISALLLFFDRLLLHVSRGVRWDSDHVVTFSDDLKALMAEVVRADALSRIHIALDFFDGSINRVGAYVIGARAVLKAVLIALLEPTKRIRELEEQGDLFARLALLEEIKALPFGAVWDGYCERMGTLPGDRWIDPVRQYESAVLSKRG